MGFFKDAARGGFQDPEFRPVHSQRNDQGEQRVEQRTSRDEQRVEQRTRRPCKNWSAGNRQCRFPAVLFLHAPIPAETKQRASRDQQRQSRGQAEKKQPVTAAEPVTPAESESQTRTLVWFLALSS